MDPKDDSFTDQVSRSAKVRTAIPSKHAKINLFRFSVFRLKIHVPSNENRFKTTFGGHLSMSQDGLFCPIFKTVKKRNLAEWRRKTGDKKGASALVSAFKLAKSGFLSGGGVVFLLLPVIRVHQT